MNIKLFNILLLFFVIENVTTVNWGTNNWAKACNFFTFSFMSVLSTSSDCGKICATTIDCSHYSWTTLYGGTCWLKKGIVSKKDAFDTLDPTMVCGIIVNPLKSAISWGNNTWARSCDFNTTNLMNVLSNSSYCAKICEKTVDCTHYTWTIVNAISNGKCWLKTGNVTKNDAFNVFNSTVICGIVKSPLKSLINWGNKSWAKSCDFRTVSFLNVSSNSTDCDRVCVKSIGCTHYTWIKNNNGTCLMKKGNVTKNDAFNSFDNSMVCGIIQNSIKTTTKIITTTFNRTTIKTTTVNTTTIKTTTVNTTTIKLTTIKTTVSNTTKITSLSIKTKINETEINWNDNNWANSCNFRTPSFMNVSSNSSECDKICEKSIECTHYTWIKDNNGTCSMKKGNVTKNDAFNSFDNSMICGIVQDSSKSGFIYVTVDFNETTSKNTTKNILINWGNNYWAESCDFRTPRLINVSCKSSECIDYCKNTIKCTHFTWTSLNDGTCWLKTGNVSKLDAFSTNDQFTICGIVEKPLLPSRINRGKLLWSDEFDSLSNFDNNWIFDIGRFGNIPQQFYTNSNIIIENDTLIIEARKETIAKMNYTSTRLKSKLSLKYGILEMRAKIPYGIGTWSAFWLRADKISYQWPLDGEIDIMENVGFDQNTIRATINCNEYNHVNKTHKMNSVNLMDAVNEYHVYTLEWTNTTISIYVDSVKYFIYEREANSTYDTWPFDNSYNIILNLAIGGSWGGINGIDDSIFPSKYYIDYVRYYELGDEIEPIISGPFFNLFTETSLISIGISLKPSLITLFICVYFIFT